MNRQNKIWLCGFFLAGIISLHLWGDTAWAAENTGNWRSTYDLVLKWINFLILVFVVVKFGKAPLMNFLKGQKEKWVREIKELEDNKANMDADISQSLTIIEESDMRFAELKERIAQQGEQKKQEIIETARQHSQIMFDNAQRRIESHIMEARNAFKAQMVDAAIALAMERLSQEITAADNQKFLDQYMVSIQAE